jgi:hypothetical protein
VCDWSQQRLQATGEFNVIDAITDLRRDRVTIVQSEEQYEFCCLAARLFLGLCYFFFARRQVLALVVMRCLLVLPLHLPTLKVVHGRSKHGHVYCPP